MDNRKKINATLTLKRIEFYFHKYALKCVADIMSINIYMINSCERGKGKIADGSTS